MNKKGFAISVILYSIVFLIISILYITLGILKTRYNVCNDSKHALMEYLNSAEHLYDRRR